MLPTATVLAPPPHIPLPGGSQAGNSRWVLLVLWIARHGAGIVPPRDVVLAARRLRVS
jgi:hypothetical protein